MDLDTARWRQLDAVLERALERPHGERRGFVMEVCGDDSGLARELLRLLEIDDRAGGLLERPPGELVAELQASAWVGTRVGPYRLGEVLGSGGMGAVFRAERDDGQFGQEVAVKLLHSPVLDGEAYLRMRAERQILARLHHPNVARLYDGGCTADGRPYLVMELLDGEPIDRYCDHHRLSIEARLELCRQVCSAVDHAHQRLLVHRDLKPSNILVTEGGIPKLLDFGIAKALGADDGETPTPATRTGHSPMTLRYASPEQVRGAPLTTASDVYSLGVLLYELLTGRSPYRPAAPGRHELERAVCEQDPPRPSATAAAPTAEATPSPRDLARRRGGSGERELERRLRGDLDAIVLKAMRKEPEKRYRSAAELAEELARHLDHRPVGARAGSLRYRVGRFAARHRLAVVSGVLVGAMAVVAAVAELRGARRTAVERDKAEAVTTLLIDAFAQADPSHSGVPVTAAQVLEQGAERLERELGDQPLVKAALLQAIGEAYAGLGDLERADALLAQGLAVRRRLLGGGDLAVAESRTALGAVRRDRADYDGAEELLRQALAVRRAQLGDHPDTARTLSEIATLDALRNRFDEAEEVFGEALAIFRRALPPTHMDILDTLSRRAEMSFDRGDYEASAARHREVLDLQRQVYGDDHPEVAISLGNLAAVALREGRLADSRELNDRALVILRRAYVEDHPLILACLHNLAFAAHRSGALDEAAARYEEVLALRRRRLGVRHPEVATTLRNLGVVRMEQGNLEAAQGDFEESLEISREAFGEQHSGTAYSLCHLGEVHRRQGHLELARGLVERCLAAMQAVYGRDNADLAVPFLGLGRVALDRGDPAAAQPSLRQALALRRRFMPADHWRIGEAAGELGRCLAALGEDEEAEPLLRERLETYSRQFAPEDARRQLAERQLAAFDRRAGRAPAVPTGGTR